ATDRFVMEVLEAPAIDSYFNWGFFDGVLMQKEYFSTYVFEDTAAELLASDADLKEKFEAWRMGQNEKPSAREQLNWIYRHSPYLETNLMVLPIGRILAQ